MARDGFEIYSYSAHAIQDKTKWLTMPEYGWQNYLNENGTVKKEGTGHLFYSFLLLAISSFQLLAVGSCFNPD